MQETEQHHDAMEESKILTETFLGRFLTRSPLAPLFLDKVSSDFLRMSGWKFPAVFPYAHPELETSNPDLPDSAVRTAFDLLATPGGFNIKSLRQSVRDTSRTAWYPRDETVTTVYFDAFGGVTGMLVEQTASRDNPRRPGSSYTLTTRYGFDAAGRLTTFNHPPNHDFGTKIVIEQHLPDDTTPGPTDIELHFPIRHGVSGIDPVFPVFAYFEDTRSPTAMEDHWPHVWRVPYSSAMIADLTKRGIILPTEIAIEADGGYAFDVGLQGDTAGVTERIYIPSRTVIAGETMRILHTAVSPHARITMDHTWDGAPEIMPVWNADESFV